MSNYTKIGKVEGARTELHDLLGLTGADVCHLYMHIRQMRKSISFSPAGERL